MAVDSKHVSALFKHYKAKEREIDDLLRYVAFSWWSYQESNEHVHHVYTSTEADKFVVIVSSVYDSVETIVDLMILSPLEISIMLNSELDSSDLAKDYLADCIKDAEIPPEILTHMDLTFIEDEIKDLSEEAQVNIAMSKLL